MRGFLSGGNPWEGTMGGGTWAEGHVLKGRGWRGGRGGVGEGHLMIHAK